MDQILDITADNGIPFRVVYGHRTFRNGTKSTVKVVAFYDRRHPHTEYGQFIGDYDITTICNHMGGLDLYGGEPDWTMDDDSMRVVKTWLFMILNRA